MTTTITAYRTDTPTGRDGFAQLLRGEWTKFRTVRGWLIATAAAAVVMVLLGVFTGAASHSTIQTSPDAPAVAGHPYVPIGPDGEAVSDSFYFVHQPLDGAGSITAKVSSLTARSAQLGQGSANQTSPAGATGGVQPWTKAGLIIKANTSQGSAYAAIMVTGSHGVRMQYNYTGDIAGPTETISTTSPQWLRLTRAGDTITGYASTDGTTWTTVGAIHLTSLPTTAQAGPFVASPDKRTFNQQLGGGSSTGGPTIATATFGALDLQGQRPTSSWTGTAVAASPLGAGGLPAALVGGFHTAGGAYTVSGSGDIAPDAGQSGSAIGQVLVGGFAALIVMIVLGVLFITTEYRRGLIRTSLTVSPRRGRVLLAKATVIGAVTFVTALVGAAIAVPISERILRANGNFINPITALTEIRVIAGTAALLAVATVLGLAVGTILRRSAAAITAVLALVVLPYILATSGALSAGASQWLLRVSPAAGFAIQQSIPAYPQVDLAYTPTAGFYPLAPWVGFAVLCAWAALALGVAIYLLRRRDA
jgi:ABC-type transport system involved in multi-copper enzyme maturation permease subunit